MLGLYFSGTGNSRYALHSFLEALGKPYALHSIEEAQAKPALLEHNDITIAYPVYYSSIPLILRNFINDNHNAFAGKSVFLIATMGLWSGDGTGYLARILQKYGADIQGGLQLKMPDCIADIPLLKRPKHKNKALLEEAKQKISKAAEKIKTGRYPQEGLYFINHIAGFFGQRLYFGHHGLHYHKYPKVDMQKCILCLKCVKACPMQNLSEKDKAIAGRNKCIICYRCANLCPAQAITLLGRKVHAQHQLTDYL